MAGETDRVRLENPLSEVALGFGVALQQDGREWEAVCPFHQEDTPSFTIFPGKDGVERFMCFGCHEQGDVIDFVQKIKGVDFKEAMKILGGEIKRDNIKPRAMPEARDVYAGIYPLPSTGEIQQGKKVRLYNPKRADDAKKAWGTITPSMVFPYRLAGGDLFGYVLRHDFTDQKTGKPRKETPMVMWVRLPDGSECWSRYPFPKPRPIYGLDELAAGQVVVVEGEKCRDAMKRATGRNVVSWAGGTNGIDHTDWSPLAGRSVVIWPDADAPGRDTAERLGAILTGLGCVVKIIEVPADQPKGWDVADAVADGWKKPDIDGFMKDHVRAYEPKKPVADEPKSADVVVHPVQSSADYYGGDWVPDHYADAGEDRWEPVYDILDAEPQLQRIADEDRLIEVSSKRREVPASGRALPTRYFAQWGGNADELREWSFLTGPEKFINVHTGERMSKTSFDMTQTIITPVVEIENAKGEKTTIKPKPSQALIEFNDGLIASDTMYRPDVDAMLVWRDGIRFLNSYLPSTVPEAAEDWERHDAWRIVQDHIHNVIPDGADLIIKWLAHNVQYPGKKILWSPVVVGKQGDGKTTIGKVLQMSMGARNVQPVSPESLFSDYTSWAEGTAVRVLEEIRVTGQNRSSVMDKLKPMITNDAIDVVGKGSNGRTIANVTNYLALTNHEDALAIDDGDRRWWIGKTRFLSREEVMRELGKDYWRKLHDAIDCHPGILRGWLLSVDLSNFDRFSAPEMTQAKRMMIEASRSPLEAAILEAIELGSSGVGKAVASTDSLKDAVQALGAGSVNTTNLYNVMRKLGWERFDATIKWNDKTRRVYYLPEEVGNLKGEALRNELRRRLDETLLDQPEQQLEMGSADDW